MTVSTSVLLALVWPFLVAAAAWAVAVWALQQPDEQSTLIARLTTPNGVSAERPYARAETLGAETSPDNATIADLGDDAP